MFVNDSNSSVCDALKVSGCLVYTDFSDTGMIGFIPGRINIVVPHTPSSSGVLVDQLGNGLTGMDFWLSDKLRVQ